MVIWPWNRFRQLEQSYLDMVERHNRTSARHNDAVDRNGQLETTIAQLRSEIVSATHAAEITAINLRTAERDLERLANEHNTLQADFKALVGQVAGKVPPKSGSFDFGRDPFTEDPKIPTEWLTDDSELPDIASEDLLDRGQSEDGEQRGPAARPGAAGSS